MERKRVLVVDDDPDIRTVLSGVYRRAGFEVASVSDGRAAMCHVLEQGTDLVVLDLGLPGLDGLSVLERIRETASVPILVLSARTLESDKVTALVAGADDYVTKPYGNGELIARTIALLRRCARSQPAPDVIDDGLVRMDLVHRDAQVEGRPVTLTPTDWALLLAFARRPGLVLSAGQLLDLAWHDPVGIGPDRVKFAVLRLRRRLGWQDPPTSPIESVRGFGYRYRPTRSVDRPVAAERISPDVVR